MPGADAEAFDEFDFIAEVLRPLTNGAPEALGLRDDAAVLPNGADGAYVVSADVMVEGGHFLPDDPPAFVARKLLRVNLSDLAAKGAEPYGYLLTTAWPRSWGPGARRSFADGLAEDQREFGLSLFGGDTTATAGPAVFGVTIFGRSPQDGVVRRSGASPGDRILISGTIGDGWLGLLAATGAVDDLDAELRSQLVARYRLPQPRTALAALLRRHASAAADVSDGLLADAGHLAAASSIRVELELGRLPLSAGALAWLKRQDDRIDAVTRLATGGDDYEIVCAAAPDHASALVGAGFTDIGRATTGEGVAALLDGREIPVGRRGWTHA